MECKKIPKRETLHVQLHFLPETSPVLRLASAISLAAQVARLLLPGGRRATYDRSFEHFARLVMGNKV